MRVAGTGHRPEKLGGYNNKAFLFLVGIAEEALRTLKPEVVISGMAIGWDMALAQAAINLEIPFIAAVPFLGQETAWRQEKTKKYYHNLLAKAKEVVIVSEGGFSNAKMQIRNEWMVDNCDLVLAMHDGTTGGTYNCVKYAEKKTKKMINLYNKYKKNE